MNLSRPRGVRQRLLFTVVASTACVVVITTAAFNLLLWHTLSADASAAARDHAAARAAAVFGHGGGVTKIGEKAGIGGETWVFVGGRLFEGPNASAVLAAEAWKAALRPGSILHIAPWNALLASTPIISKGRTLGAVVAGVSLAPYERAQRIALIATLALSVAAIAAVTLAARWLLAVALRPVDQMTAVAESWSATDLGRRFAAGEPHDELSRLAATLDRMLDRIAASLHREQRFSAEVSHELRTPLTAIRAEAGFALRGHREPAAYRESLASILESTRRMSGTVDTLVLAAHEEAALSRGRTSVAVALEESARAISHLAHERGIELRVEPPSASLYVGVESDVATRIVCHVLENACRYARHRVLLTASRQDGAVEVRVRDDGPGVAAVDLERVFEPGMSDSTTVSRSLPAGAGLGLPLARRLARAAGGDVTVAAHKTGACFVVRLPPG